MSAQARMLAWPALRFVNDPPSDNCEHRADVADLPVGHGEIIAVEDRHVCALAWLDHSEFVAPEQEPGILAGEQTDSLRAAQPLPVIDLLADRVHAGDDILHV